jgi:hypothetical protein
MPAKIRRDRIPERGVRPQERRVHSGFGASVSGIDCRRQQGTHGKPRAGGFIGDDFQQLLDTPAPDKGDNPELGKMGADRIDHGGLLADGEMTGSMKHQTAQLAIELRRTSPSRALTGLVASDFRSRTRLGKSGARLQRSSRGVS